ncbi:PREDICTED: ovostatin homolog 1, partial [Propithecus coquereli]|uniref:ovostatin homolog 1 n=1 Tax=Propithecus coquereli TaxID=379532 RepID=UPI00063F8D7F
MMVKGAIFLSGQKEIGNKGVQISEKTSISVTQSLGSVNFENMDTFYRRGIPYFGTLKFSGPNDVPMVSKLLQLNLNNKFIGNYTTDENGEAQFAIDTSDIFDPEFNLQSPIYTAWKGSFSFPINVSADLAPVAVMLVYTLHPSGEIVADSVRFQVDKCFKNKVSIQFSKERGLPGSNASLYLQAAPDSFCALGAVDKSVLLLQSEQQLSAESVYNLLPNIELHGYFYDGLNLDDGKVDPCIPEKEMFYNGLYCIPTNNYRDGDIYNIVRDMGLKVFTNLHYRKPEICSMGGSLPFPGPLPLRNYAMKYSFPSRIACRGGCNDDNVEQAIIETVRTNFPETWIWDLVSVDSSGLANLSFLIPDTITQWKANGFCVNGDAGFGVSPTVTLEVSQSFFVEIASPFSVIRNEQFDLIISVFSYLDTCVEISVQLEASQNYETNLNTLKNNGSEIIHAGEKKTYVWTVKPKKLGKQLSVSPEGIERETTQSYLICTKGTKASKQVVLDLPNDVVEGSTRGFFTVVGDFLGLAVQNLDDPLQMPYRNAEQNVALLASNTYVLDYLQSTEQLTEELKSRAFSLLSKGYQNQLSFKNSDGSYDMFWSMNQEGSIWLSALSFKTLERMKKYIFIDENVQKQTLIWLLSKQKSNGCFENDGEFFSNAWENLLQMPFGCGEQNVALVTPNIYILDCLNQTQQLTEEIKSKAVGYLTIGKTGIGDEFLEKFLQNYEIQEDIKNLLDTPANSGKEMAERNNVPQATSSGPNLKPDNQEVETNSSVSESDQDGACELRTEKTLRKTSHHARKKVRPTTICVPGSPPETDTYLHVRGEAFLKGELVPTCSKHQPAEQAPGPVQQLLGNPPMALCNATSTVQLAIMDPLATNCLLPPHIVLLHLDLNGVNATALTPMATAYTTLPKSYCHHHRETGAEQSPAMSNSVENNSPSPLLGLPTLTYGPTNHSI